MTSKMLLHLCAHLSVIYLCVCVHVCGAHSSHDTCVGQDSFQELVLSSTMRSSGPLDLAANTFSLAGGWSWILNFWFHCFCFPRATTTGMCHCARLSSHTLMLCYEVCIYFIYTYVSGCYSLFIFNLFCFEMLCNPNWPQIYKDSKIVFQILIVS